MIANTPEGLFSLEMLLLQCPDLPLVYNAINFRSERAKEAGMITLKINKLVFANLPNSRLKKPRSALQFKFIKFEYFDKDDKPVAKLSKTMWNDNVDDDANDRIKAVMEVQNVNTGQTIRIESINTLKFNEVDD